MKAQKVFENIEFKRGSKSITKALGIGDPKFQAIQDLKDFATEMGWEYQETKRGIHMVTTPATIPYQRQQKNNWMYPMITDLSDHLRYKMAWIDGWVKEGTPLSLRKVYMLDGKEAKQNLMGRFGTGDEVIDRIRLNYPKEMRKANK